MTQYVPEPQPEPSKRDRVKRWAFSVFAFAVFGPFAIIYLLVFAGETMPDGWFGTWFMGALTVCGIVTTWEMFRSVRTHGLGELGCALPVAGFTGLWGWIFIKGIGLIE